MTNNTDDKGHLLSKPVDTPVHELEYTPLSNRDRDIFLALINNDDAHPSQTLVAAALRYKQRIGHSA